MVNIHNATLKKLFIDIVQHRVIKHTEIVVCCGMIMHHIVMNCVNNNRPMPTNICFPSFINTTLNYNLAPLNPLLIATIESFNPTFTPAYENMHGHPWLLGYLTKMNKGNIELSMQLKWRAVIKDSINALQCIQVENWLDQTWDPPSDLHPSIYPP